MSITRVCAIHGESDTELILVLYGLVEFMVSYCTLNKEHIDSDVLSILLSYPQRRVGGGDVKFEGKTHFEF